MWGEKGSWTVGGTIWSVAAGLVTATGALGIILAFKFRGSPLYVMPLVFGCAPVVSTFVATFMARTFRDIGPVFIAGIVMVAIGAFGVMFFKPTAENVKVVAADDGSITITKTRHIAGGEQTDTWKAASLEELKTKPDLKQAFGLWRRKQPLTGLEFFMIPFAIGLTALCWGSYGPVLHQGQMKMQGSRLRPLLCVGLAYFLIAVIAPLLMMPAFPEPGGWKPLGTIWSLVGGALGALGSLGIILAFNAGGKPIYVMPLVFGCAPIINTLVTIIEEETWDQVPALFFGSLVLVIIGAVTVLIFAPKAKHGPPGKKDDAAGKHERELAAK
jgi:glucose uptake protein GlcU